MARTAVPAGPGRACRGGHGVARRVLGFRKQHRGLGAKIAYETLQRIRRRMKLIGRIDIAVVITTILFLFSSEGRSLAVFAGLDFRPVSFVGCGFGAGVQNHSCASSDMVRVRHECDVVGVFRLPAHQEKQQARRNLSFCPFGNASIARFERIQNTAGAYAPRHFDQVDFRSWAGRPLPFRRSALLALGINRRGPRF